MDSKTQAAEYLAKLQETISKLSLDEVEALFETLHKALVEGAKVYVCGNGGSALTASHFACDFNKGVSFGREHKFRVISLTDNIGVLMAYANDVDYDSVFVEQLRGIVTENDVLIGISGSGNSPNVLKAVEYCNAINATTIGITGYNGGKLKEMATISVNANIDDMQISEDIHMILVHMLMRMFCDSLDNVC